MFTANWLFKRLGLSVAQANRAEKAGWSVLSMFPQSNDEPLNLFLHLGLILPPSILEKNRHMKNNSTAFLDNKKYRDKGWHLSLFGIGLGFLILCLSFLFVFCFFITFYCLQSTYVAFPRTNEQHYELKSRWKHLSRWSRFQKCQL